MRFTRVLGMIIVALTMISSSTVSAQENSLASQDIKKLLEPYRNTFGSQEVDGGLDKFAPDGLKRQCEPLTRKAQCDKDAEELTTLFGNLWNAIKFDAVVLRGIPGTKRGATRQGSSAALGSGYQDSYLIFLQKYKEFVICIWLAADGAEQAEWKAQGRSPRKDAPAPPQQQLKPPGT